MIPKLSKVFGIQNFSPSIRIEKEMPAIRAMVQEVVREVYTPGKTFKITAKRSDHSFELDSNGLNQELGGAVIEAIPEIQVQMKKPDINLELKFVKMRRIYLMKRFAVRVDCQWAPVVVVC